MSEPAAPDRAARHDASQSGPASELGNQVVQGLFDRGLRAKLEVGGADDPEEREADALAEQVMMASFGKPCACGGGCPSCSGGKAKIRRKAEAGASAPSIAGQGFGNRSGRPLGLSARRHFEPRFGVDFGGVRIHDDAATHGMARGIGARAFAIGGDIGFAESRYQPETAAGRALLAHELAHVALGHGQVRRTTDEDLGAKAEWQEKQQAEREAARQRHEAWKGTVDKKFSGDLTGQSKTIEEEKEKVGFAVLSQRVAALDAAAGGEGWLNGALAEQGYAGPDLATVRQAWGDAVIAAEGLGVAKDGPDAQAKLAALQSVPAFYDDLATLSAAVELAHKTRHDKALEAAKADYERKLAAYQARERMERDSSPRGEPGARAAAGAMALMRGPPPQMAAIPDPPQPISATIAPARERLYAADSPAQWLAVTGDVRVLGAGLSKLVVSTLPETSEARIGVEYVEKLEADLNKFEKDNPLSWRVPAVFYPLDQTSKKKGEDGTEVELPRSIPWQFYLTNTGVKSLDEPAVSGGQWVLSDLTSGRGFKNKAPISDFDLARLQQGEAVDPPLELFAELNASIRFPEGRLYFTLPSGTSYVLTTTEPITLSDFLAGLGLVLAAVAITAGVIASGGAAAPAAVAFYAGMGAAAVGIGSTLAELHEKDTHGILMGEDVDKAMVSIGLDILSAASMGLGRIVSAPGAAAKFGSRFVLLSRITKGAQVANLLGDSYRAMTVTEAFIKGFAALDKLPPDQRDKARAQLVRQALVTGALMTIALKGDIADIRASSGFHVDPDGALVPHGTADGGAGEARPHAEADGTAARSAPHAEVVDPVHAATQASANAVPAGKETHGAAVAGTGEMRDIYFCSDHCTRLVDRLSLVVSGLPHDHPMRPAFEDMLSKAVATSKKIGSGKMTDKAVEEFVEATMSRIRKLAGDTRDGVDVQRLLNADPNVPHAGADEWAANERSMDIREGMEAEQAQRQALAGQPKRGTYGDPAQSPEARDMRTRQGMGVQGEQPREPKTDLYSPEVRDTPHYPGGIPPAEGGRITGAVRSYLELPQFTGAKGDPNVAVAEVHIDGESQLLTTVSGSELRPGMVELPDKTTFKVINSGYQTRAQDTEAKFLEHIASTLPANAKGTIHLFTERPACTSCSGVIKQFEKRFPGVKVIVTHLPPAKAAPAAPAAPAAAGP